MPDTPQTTVRETRFDHVCLPRPDERDYLPLAATLVGSRGRVPLAGSDGGQSGDVDWGRGSVPNNWPPWVVSNRSSK
jgi:hypothetical protein